MHAFLFFHCNLAYSSIAEEQRSAVIDQCYVPLLELALRQGVPIGIEATGWTLEQIAQLRPQWLAQLQTACADGQVEFIGSGYSQIIGPLVPACVNAANQRLGQESYERLLGFRPSLALINEQTFSAGILEQYTDAGYTAFIMEWDNCSLAHPHWPESYRYAPQRLRDMQGRPLHLLWNQSIVFQQMQRVVHGDTEMSRYLEGMQHFAQQEGVLCLYGNDAEIFNFRPGRFSTEAPLTDNEWATFAHAVHALRDEQGWRLLLPSQVLLKAWPDGGHILRLETAAQPVPVKKQPKYNLLRWAVSGRDDARINGRCHALAQALCKAGATDADWKRLCRLWSSDARTHITAERWEKFLHSLEEMEKQWLPINGHVKHTMTTPEDATPCPQQGRLFSVATSTCTAVLNRRRGMAFESVTFPDVAPTPLFGTLPHGFFRQIPFAADFYSGHVVMEQPGRPKMTDLEPVEACMWEDATGRSVTAEIHGFFCPLRKTVRLSKQEPEITLCYDFAWGEMPPSSLRLLHVTLFPESFDASSLFYATHNGGRDWEYFALDEEVNHGRPVSAFVSATDALGMTEGKIRIGDKKKYLEITTSMCPLAPVAMIQHATIGDTCLTRLVLSLREMDDTLRTVCYAPSQMAISVHGVKN